MFILMLYKKDGSKDIFEFSNLKLLYDFLLEYTQELILDGHMLIELEYDIIFKNK